MRELESSLNKNYDEEEIRGLIKKEEENKGYLNLYTEQLDGVKNDIKKSENELEKIKTEYKAKYSIIYEVEELTAQLEAKKSAKEKHAQDTDIHMKNLFLIMILGFIKLEIGLLLLLVTPIVSLEEKMSN